MLRCGSRGKTPGVHHGGWLFLLFKTLPYQLIQMNAEAVAEAARAPVQAPREATRRGPLKENKTMRFFLLVALVLNELVWSVCSGHCDGVSESGLL